MPEELPFHFGRQIVFVKVVVIVLSSDRVATGHVGMRNQVLFLRKEKPRSRVLTGWLLFGLGGLRSLEDDRSLALLLLLLALLALLADAERSRVSASTSCKLTLSCE